MIPVFSRFKNGQVFLWFYYIEQKMQEKDTLILKEIANLLYHILVKMPHPSELIPKPLAPEKVWLDNADLMQKLHVSANTLQRWRNEGKLPFSKIKGKIWYLESDLNDMLDEGF